MGLSYLFAGKDRSGQAGDYWGNDNKGERVVEKNRAALYRCSWEPLIGLDLPRALIGLPGLPCHCGNGRMYTKVRALLQRATGLPAHTG